MTEELKLCKDCRHCKPKMVEEHGWFRTYETANYEFAKCHAPQNIARDPVSGDDDFAGPSYCSTQRSFPTTTCGRSARWFEPKSK